MYFHKIIINREIREELLPFDDQIDMRIFKESMERKFVSFSQAYDKYQKRLAFALEKLLFYMEASGDRVSQNVLKKDISFMESSEVPRNVTDGWHFGVLMMQAMTIQDLLAKNDS